MTLPCSAQLTLAPSYSTIKDVMADTTTASRQVATTDYYGNTSNLVLDRYYALCYSTDYTSSASPGTWSDSGIRLTTPKLTVAHLQTGYAGGALRQFSSYQKQTNKLPSEALTLTLLYSTPGHAVQDALGAGGYLSLVETQVSKCEP